MKLKLLLTFVVILCSQTLWAQTGEYSHSEEHTHPEGEKHNHYKNDIGLANSAVYFLKEKVFAYGLHVHYIRAIPKTKFGLGLGYERIFDEHKHNTIGVVFAYRPVHELTLSISPGVAFEGAHPEAGFALHIEATYGFEIGPIHLGPLLEFASDPEDYHLSAGIHLGYDF